MMQKIIIASVYLVQAGLLVYELIAQYDSRGRQNALAITNLATIAIYVLVQRYVRRRYGITLHWIVLVILSAGVWLDAVGNFQHFYARYWWWDRLTHAVGGLAATVGVYMIAVALWQAGRLAVSWRVLNLYVFCLAQTLGALYEVSEWVGDELFLTHRVQGLFDTPRDIFFNMIGGVTVVLIGTWWRMRHRAVHPPGDADRI
ncbi:MAG: hypothetical protein HY567_03505 [Candidatus Kerfeldbacteria bacterium]|nr:hypothetical protein [Candidatus Kerfeldbacteria bacterium]